MQVDIIRDMSSPRFHSRQDWILASQFRPEAEAAFCAQLEKRILTLADSSKKPPAVIFDLDSTLYEVCPRTHLILREAADSLSRGLPGPVKRAFNSLLESQVGYSISDTFQNLGLPLQSPTIQKAWTKIKGFWFDRFFSNEYLKHDRPYLLAPEFVTRLHKKGAHILYLTGRHDEKMRIGTLDCLERDGFPVGDPRVLLRMKTGTSPDDAAFKARVARAWGERFNVLACFENEPRNLIRLQSALPKSMAVFVNTVCSDKRTRPGNRLFHLKLFPKLSHS
jgi:hypothetical protein